jgi:hypothetical protein
MQAISPTDIYNIRPDIFIRGAEDRLHLQYAGEHYILRLPRAVIDTVYRFLELNNGNRAVAEVMETIPAPHRQAMHKLLEFLLQKRAAFRVANARQEAALAPVAETLTYLRSYCDDVATVFGTFAASRILLVGGSYTLTSAIKTFARLGVRHLGVLDTGVAQGGEWKDEELHSCFSSLQRWPDALMHIERSLEECVLRGYTHVLEMSGPAAAVIGDAALAGAERGRALFIDGQACMAWGAGVHALAGYARGQQSLPLADELIAGAIVSLAFFDALCGIRALEQHQYHYYRLEGEGIMHTAQFRQLIPAEHAVAACSAAGKRIAASLDELSIAPLFPLRPPMENSPPDTYVKLYTAALDWPHAGADGSPTQLRKVTGAGLTKDQCQANMLLQLVCMHDLWFSLGAADEAADVAALRVRYRNAVEAITLVRGREACPDQPSAQGTGLRESYVSFCINAFFGERVRSGQLALSSDSFSACLVLAAGGVAVYLPHSGEVREVHREAGLFALYAALWQSRQGDSDFLEIVLDANPFTAERAA